MITVLAGGSSSFESFTQFLYVMIIFIAVLALTYFVTKWIAKLGGNKYSNGNIELLEACRLNNNQYIQLVRIGGRIYALAISKDNVTLVGEIMEEELKSVEAESKTQIFSFAEIFDKVKKDKQAK